MAGVPFAPALFLSCSCHPASSSSSGRGMGGGGGGKEEDGGGKPLPGCSITSEEIRKKIWRAHLCARSFFLVVVERGCVELGRGHGWWWKEEQRVANPPFLPRRVSKTKIKYNKFCRRTFCACYVFVVAVVDSLCRVGREVEKKRGLRTLCFCHVTSVKQK